MDKEIDALDKMHEESLERLVNSDSRRGRIKFINLSSFGKSETPFVWDKESLLSNVPMIGDYKEEIISIILSQTKRLQKVLDFCNEGAVRMLSALCEVGREELVDFIGYLDDLCNSKGPSVLETSFTFGEEDFILVDEAIERFSIKAARLSLLKVQMVAYHLIKEPNQFTLFELEYLVSKIGPRNVFGIVLVGQNLD